MRTWDTSSVSSWPISASARVAHRRRDGCDRNGGSHRSESFGLAVRPRSDAWRAGGPLALSTSGHCASTLSMKRQTVLAKKKRGPPATGKARPVVVRMQPEPLKRLDVWCAAQEDRPTRAEGLRRLAEMALAGRGKL